MTDRSEIDIATEKINRLSESVRNCSPVVPILSIEIATYLKGTAHKNLINPSTEIILMERLNVQAREFSNRCSCRSYHIP